MNCLDYRRLLPADPIETPLARAHRLQCVACADHFAAHATFERSLRDALEIPVPAALTDRLLERAEVPARTDRRRFLAAAGVAGFAVAAGTLYLNSRDDPLAAACIRFVMMEETKSIMMGAMSRAEAETVLADTLPLAAIERIGRIQHIAPCPFEGGTAYHVVLAVPQDKVTLIVFPGRQVDSMRRARYDGLYATVVPRRQASVGVIGANESVVASVAGALRV